MTCHKTPSAFARAGICISSVLLFGVTCAAAAQIALDSSSALGTSGCPDDSWAETSIVDTPIRRFGHSAIWTGAEMIVWGGCRLRRLFQ